MGKFKGFLPVTIFIVVNLIIVGVVVLIETSKNGPKVATDEQGNEYTLGVSESDAPTRQISTGDKAPDFILQTYDGKVVELASLYKEKPVILQFWATWCHICEREFPENNEFSKKNKDKFHFVAVNWGQSKGEVESYIRRKNLDPTAIKFLMNESSDVVRAYGVRGTPTHAIIDKNGKVAFYNIGYTTTDQFSSVIESL